MSRTSRPLDRLGSIKLKLSVVIVGAIAIAAVVSVVGYSLGVPVLVRPIISATIGVIGMWFFAGGITSPLREMAGAAGQMAEGDYDIRVTETSQDEVGDLARAFNAMAGELAEVDQQRRDLVAMVSHELRTPITALQANLENLIDGVSEPEPDLLNRMLSQTERLGRLVAQLLDLSRLESGALALERMSVDAGALVGRVVDEVRLRHPDLPIETSIEPVDLRLEADAERLHQVLANLVDNAARYSPDNAPVTLEVVESSGRTTFRVTDQGPGIPPDQLERVFDRYHRLAAVRSRSDGEGTGLGLTIARWITELHGGSIRAEGVEPTGCRMVLVLPTGGQR